jgi:hypothetical protein
MTGRAMSDEGFLKRWSRRKTESRQGLEPAPEPLPATPDEAAVAPQPAGEVLADAPEVLDIPAEAPRLPTLDDVALLTRESDYSAFVARGVDQAVRRSALKKLFADPHFSSMDRLDVYIDDYTKPSPVSEAMLASLGHAKKLFARAVDEVLDTGADAAPDDPAIPESPSQQHPPETETR